MTFKNYSSVMFGLFTLAGNVSGMTFVLGDSFFSLQGVALNAPVAGTYDVSTISAVPGLMVTVTGNATRNTSNNGLNINEGENVIYNFSNAVTGNNIVDGSFAVGTNLVARESNQLVTNGTIANAAVASPGIELAIIENTSNTVIRYSNLSNADNVLQTPHTYSALAGTSFNFSVNNLNGNLSPTAVFIPTFEITNIPEPSSTLLLTLSGLLILRRRR